MKQRYASFFLQLFYGLYDDFRIPIFSENLADPFLRKREGKICGNPGPPGNRRPGMETLIVYFFVTISKFLIFKSIVLVQEMLVKC